LWKNEVSQRVAAHRKRKGALANDAEPQSHSNSSKSIRLSATAARVAARYAAAPSYCDLLDYEVRSGEVRSGEVRSGEVRSGEVQSGQMERKQPAEQIMLLDLQPAGPATSSEAPASHAQLGQALASAETLSQEIRHLSEPVAASRISMVAEAAAAKPDSAVDWDSDWGFGDNRAVSAQHPPQHPLSDALARESRREDWAGDEPAAAMTIAEVEAPATPAIEDQAYVGWSEPAEGSYAEAPVASAPDAYPIHGNLIEFPFELVAARKVRPRRAEGNYASAMDAEPQLSIFEVDPTSISTQPDLAALPAEAPAWSQPEWADLKLEAGEQAEIAVEAAADVKAAKTEELVAAPMNLRVLAAVFDFALVSVAFLTVAMLVVLKATVLPTLREAEIGGAVVFAAIAAAYLAISYTLARATPGMKYALLSMRTFDGQTPTREQRCRRLGALALAMLPVGLGAVWALFDEQHLSWHDRWSGTYLRRV
jgi:uncharacterized RDD family membrane protein YckC